jgi:hypothetical protein
MKPDADTFDGCRDAYLGWLYALAWQAARSDRAEAERLWHERRRLHGA